MKQRYVCILPSKYIYIYWYLYVCHILSKMLSDSTLTYLSCLKSATLGIPWVWRNPCHSWRIPWTGTLGPAWCCRPWTCCWRCDLQWCAISFCSNPALSPCSAACRRVFHPEMRSTKWSRCRAHFHQSPQGPVAWAHLNVKRSHYISSRGKRWLYS